MNTKPTLEEFVEGGLGVHQKLRTLARLYTTANADAIVEAALDAGDAIDAALAAPNKQLTVAYWQKVFGSTFQA